MPSGSASRPISSARTAIVFGSVARGAADEWSDLDLLIVADTRRPFLERYRDFEGIYEVWPRLDLLIYTPEEFAQMQAEGRPFLVHVLGEGVVIYETAAAH
jgi:predicted nucleotidyltransferase